MKAIFSSVAVLGVASFFYVHAAIGAETQIGGVSATRKTEVLFCGVAARTKIEALRKSGLPVQGVMKEFPARLQVRF